MPITLNDLKKYKLKADKLTYDDLIQKNYSFHTLFPQNFGGDLDVMIKIYSLSSELGLVTLNENAFKRIQNLFNQNDTKTIKEGFQKLVKQDEVLLNCLNYQTYLDLQPNAELAKMFPLRLFNEEYVEPILQLYKLNKTKDLKIHSMTMKAFYALLPYINSSDRDIVTYLNAFSLEDNLDALESLDLNYYLPKLKYMDSVEMLKYWNNNIKNQKEGLLLNTEKYHDIFENIEDDINTNQNILKSILLAVANEKCDLGLTRLTKEAYDAMSRFKISNEELSNPERKSEIQEAFLEHMLQPENKAILSCINYRSYFWVWGRYLKNMAIEIISDPNKLLQALKDAFMNFIPRSDSFSEDMENSLFQSYEKHKISDSNVLNSNDFGTTI